MKQLFFYILISLLPAFAYAQYTTGNKPQSAGDRIESTSYNDHKRGAARTLQYHPDGEDFVSVNGKNRYTRDRKSTRLNSSHPSSSRMPSSA